MINKQRKSIYPDYEHIQLLKACILEGESAIEAWQNWDRVTNINDIDNGSMRLLPSLYLTLRDNNIYTDYTNKVKGVYRRTLVKNKILLYSLIDIQKSFKKYNIEVITFFTNFESKFGKFSLNSLSRPYRIFFLHSSNELYKLPINIRPPNSSTFSFPVIFKTFFVPA